MKRIQLFAGGLGLAAVFGLAGLAMSQSTNSTSTGQAKPASLIPPQPHRHAETPARPAGPTTDEEVVQELILILNEAKSPMTVVMTVTALAPLGKKARPALPALIRAAERLKLLDGLEDAKDGNTPRGELAGVILGAIQVIQTGTPSQNGPACYSPWMPQRPPVVSGAIPSFAPAPPPPLTAPAAPAQTTNGYGLPPSIEFRY